MNMFISVERGIFRPLLPEEPSPDASSSWGSPSKRSTHPPRSWHLWLAVAAKALLTLAALGVLAAAALTAHNALNGESTSASSLPHGVPFCRKSNSLVVLPGLASDWAAGHKAANGSDGNSTAGLQLVVWSGIGLHKAMMDDLHAFDLEHRRWRVLRATCAGNACHQETGVPTKWGRWKAGNAQAAAGGLVVVGGDSYLPGTRCHAYENDVWRLSWPDLAWSQAAVDGGAPAPARRRGQSTMRYQDESGAEHIVLFSGRTIGKELLVDIWDLELHWPSATWREIIPPPGQSGPSSRRGHSAVLVDDAGTPQMLVYGGREDLDYFNDMWLLDVQLGQWHQIEYDGLAPERGRDHHAAVYYESKLYIWAGRSGEDYYHSQPESDLWAFDLHARTWERVEQQGAVPLARFEHSYVQYSPPGGPPGSRLIIFGGQAVAPRRRNARHKTEQVCQLNDVWELDLTTLMWTELSPPHFCSRQCRRALEGLRG